MSSTARTPDCRKFSPNIFNKSKCSHCFRQREEHSAAALECNRASRKVSKCGYLFVAPDWDFSNPLYRTKRWQRRWFVLYDDGELTYSVDEHPETVPQACIDMTKVIEVTTAEDVTGHLHSVAITAPDRVTFVKGTCSEESKWWLNVLAAFPKSRGRNKRNATFPGGQATTILQASMENSATPLTRNRHNSYHKDALTSAQSAGVLIGCSKSDRGGENIWQHVNMVTNADNSRHSVADDDEEDDGVETGEDDDEDDEGDEDEIDGGEKVKETNNESDTKNLPGTVVGGGQDENNRNAGNEITNRVSPPCLLIEDIRRDEKTIKDIANTITNLSQQQKNRWSTSTAVNNVLNSHHQLHHAPDEVKKTCDEADFQRTQPQQSGMRPKSLPLAANSTPAIVSAIVKKIPPVLAADSPHANNRTSPRVQLQLKQLQQRNHSNHQHWQRTQAHERGDPDGGCNLDDLSSSYLAKTAELRVNSATLEETLISKKGWLMKQDSRTGDWTKHWFTLSGVALFYYRDPISEERGVLDGVLDVNSLTSICEVTASKNYAFQLTTWDKRRLTLASLSPNSRNSWMAVLRNAAGLPALASINNAKNAVAPSETKVNTSTATTELNVKENSKDDIKREIEKDFIKAQRNHEIIIQKYQAPEVEKNKIVSVPKKVNSPQVIITNASVTANSPGATVPQATNASTPTTPKTAIHFSSDEEYRTASEGGRRDSVDWGSPLSPSPPVPTLSLLRAKERGCLRAANTPPNYARLHKRSRSSPPSSRRSTFDSVGSDELPASIKESVSGETLKIDEDLQFRLSAAEKERNILRDEAKAREARMSELLTTLERTEQELTARIHEMEEVRENLTTQLQEAKRNAADIVARLSDELEESQKKIKDLEDRLARGIDENDALYKRLRELERGSPTSLNSYTRNKLKRMDSLSDLTQISEIDPYGLERDTLADEYNELRSRFEKAINEIKAMKRELKESQYQFDSLEISYTSLKQDLERKKMVDQSQLQMMAARIQDLTLKYTNSERQVRTLKQKLAKTERRRSLSLKGKEQLTVSKELEIKVNELENRCDEMEKTCNDQGSKKAPSRRRSLESSASTDSLQFMIRVNDLEKRFEGMASSSIGSVGSSPTPSTSTATTNERMGDTTLKLSEHLIDRLRCLENVLVTSKDRLEQILQQLQNLRSSRNRRSVSPISDRKDSYRYVERVLNEVVKLIRESCESCIVSGSCTSGTSPNNVLLLPASSPVKLALLQLEAQLRDKLSELLKQRRMLRERNELTQHKDLALLAERIAYESVCFGKLRDSLARSEQPDLFGERQMRAEVAETSHLMTMLKAKLGGKCALKSTSGSLDVLAGVLARRLLLSSHRKSSVECAKLAPVDQNVLDDLLRQQHELNVITKRYKNNAMESLAAGLAAETLSYISSSSNDLVQGAVQEAWRQAQETVNAELVQSEIAHIMLRNAERFEHSIVPAFGYTLNAEERLSFEHYADAVHDALRKEMELAVVQLTQSYEKAVQSMKRGQWRLHMEPERKVSEGRQMLSDFADIIAHKALVDARIIVLRGEHASAASTRSSNVAPPTKFGITALQKYENLFEELANELQINSPDDILAEADFEFMYKQHTIDFLNDREVLTNISTFLGQLEDSLIALQCEANSTTSISRTSISIENLQDVCHKCCDLRQQADQLLQAVQQKLQTPCQHCKQLRDRCCTLEQQHANDLARLQQTHAKDLNALRQQLENQRNALKSLEAEKNAINGDLHRSEELIDERERELEALADQLARKEAEIQSERNKQQELLQRFEGQAEKLSSFQSVSESLSQKLARQDEDYAVLLQERDYLQGELAKEHERCARLEKRLEMLEVEQGKQLECLQDAYRDQLLSHCTDFTNAAADEESFRKRYQAEIEQLRTLCEKGLTAMESSHRRVINNLEEQHKREIERLLLEKETALAEETQATLAALDAMRKAHQSEVQREVARFKQEFLKQFHGHALDSNQVKEEELEELRQEILSFSEKYSIKCVENAALEEKLRSVNQKLRQFQQMQQLELRSKQFRAHLASEDPLRDANFFQGLTTTKDDESAGQDSECNAHVHVEFAANAPKDPEINSTASSASSSFKAALPITPASSQTCTDAPKSLSSRGVNNSSNDDADSSDSSSHYAYSYEPCYKQVNLYSYHSRSGSEGVKSSTFGKSLKSPAIKLTPSNPSSSMANSRDGPQSAATQQQRAPLYKTARTINITNTPSSPRQNQYSSKLDKQPVDGTPKSFSANNYNVNSLSDKHKHGIEHTEKLNLVNSNLNNLNGPRQLSVNEKTAVNLNSFADILRRVGAGDEPSRSSSRSHSSLTGAAVEPVSHTLQAAPANFNKFELNI